MIVSFTWLFTFTFISSSPMVSHARRQWGRWTLEPRAAWSERESERERERERERGRERYA